MQGCRSVIINDLVTESHPVAAGSRARALSNLKLERGFEYLFVHGCLFLVTVYVVLLFVGRVLADGLIACPRRPTVCRKT
jgi:hypothetical protein